MRVELDLMILIRCHLLLFPIASPAMNLSAIVQWLGYDALTVEARVQFPVAENIYKYICISPTNNFNNLIGLNFGRSLRNTRAVDED